MKELLKGIWTLICAIIVSSLVFSIGTLYSLGYSFWLTVSLKKPLAFFKFWWRLLDGFAASLGYMLYHVSVGLDMAWNVNGEIIEDIVTTEEDTMFTEKNITVSSSIGKLEIDNKLTKSGQKFSKLLNFFFGQKNHATDSWKYDQAKKEIDKQYFN